MKMGTIGWIAFILVIVGALNWGLVGFFDWNLVDAIFGVGATLGRIVYALVGIAGIYMLIGAVAKKPE